MTISNTDICSSNSSCRISSERLVLLFYKIAGHVPLRHVSASLISFHEKKTQGFWTCFISFNHPPNLAQFNPKTPFSGQTPVDWVNSSLIGSLNPGGPSPLADRGLPWARRVASPTLLPVQMPPSRRDRPWMAP